MIAGTPEGLCHLVVAGLATISLSLEFLIARLLNSSNLACNNR